MDIEISVFYKSLSMKPELQEVEPLPNQGGQN